MQRFMPSEIIDYLTSRGLVSVSDRQRIEDDIMSADGRIGRALEILESPEEVEADRRLALSVISALKQSAPYSELYTAVTALPQKRVELSAALEGISLALSDLIKVKLSGNAVLTFFKNRGDALAIAEGLSVKKLLAVYDAVRDAADDNAKNANISALITCLGAKIKLI